MDSATAKHVGARLLGEVEEGSLEELLDSLRVNLTSGPSNNVRPDIPIPALANIAARYHKATQSTPPPVLSVSGRYLPLLYHLISTLIAEPHNYTVVVVDAESRFDVTRLVCSSPSNNTGNSSYPAQLPDLRHVYVYRPARGQDQVRAAVAAAGEWMLYGAHGSRAREWWGTVVIGGGSGVSVKGDVNAGWKGWLRVEREEVAGFPAGVSVEEALRDRNKRQEVVEDAGWVAGSRVGSYVWRDN
ncbi:hypothetical protein F4815DRAFT_477264 [Daldinia loculata]|nr:hypothetical protein F4815DRAFT_477264 [Daldinia loculata]